ncbi:MAG: sulfatase-like hydrolase/transferase [Betaproteobacteria bacterium]|nr:sulfatase-like hydrolase/transferase [Betaproteobacteria bacterium]
MSTTFLKFFWRTPIALFIAFTWPSWALLSGFYEINRLAEQALLTVILGSAILATPLTQRTLWLISLTIYPVAAVWAVFSHEFGGPPHVGTVIALTHSNFQEITEWLRSHWLASGVVLIIFGVSLLAACHAPRQPVFGQRRRRGIFAGLLLLTFSAIIQHDYWYGKRTSWALVTSADIEAIWPVGLFWKVADFIMGRLPDSVLAPSEFVNNKRAPPLAVQRQLDGPMAVILVIGESERADTFNPLLRPDLTKALTKQLVSGRMVWLSDVCAGATLTVYSVSPLVTGVKPEDEPGNANTRPSGLAYFKQAGFTTAWISNQDSGIFGENGWDVAEFPLRSSTLKPDEVMLPAIQRFLRGSTLSAAVVHMLGSHFDYENRYPENAAVISTDGLSGLALERAQYANSVAYSGQVLARIVAMLEDERRPAVMIFTSDHGENLKDDSRGLWRHAGSVTVSSVEIKVPAFVAWNQAYADVNSQALAVLKTNAGQPLRHANLFPLWLRLGGLETPAVSPADSPDSTAFIPPATRPFRNTANFAIELCDNLR